MEPGGIEPPSRDSQQDASTRVSGDLISVRVAATGGVGADPAISNSSPALLSTTRAGQPDVFDPRRIGRQAGIDPKPPTTTISSSWIDRMMLKASGEMNLSLWPSSAPARPVMKALMAKAMVL